MKRLKILMMAAVLTITLCACGGEESGQGDSVGAVAGQEEQKAQKEQKNEQKNEEKPYECLQELLEATPEQRLRQIGDMVFRLDNSMSLSDAMEILKSSGGEFAIYDTDGLVELAQGGNPKDLTNSVVEPGCRQWFKVCVDGEWAYSVEVYSFGDAFTKLSDEEVKLTHISSQIYDVTYYFKGLRSDGEGLTYDSIKELMKDYEGNMIEGEYYDTYRIAYNYQWLDVDGKSHKNQISFFIDREDKTCTGVSDEETFNM